MRTSSCLSLFLIYAISFTVLLYPFIPGTYDPLSISLSTSVQLFSGFSLLTCIPATLWLYQIIKHRKVNNDNHAIIKKRKLYLRIYLWTGIFVSLIVILITTSGISRLLGIILSIGLIFFARLIFKKISQSKPGDLSSICMPFSLVMLPILLLVFQFIFDKPLTSWSRAIAINNSSELIGEIERYKVKHGKYPLTLNAIWKDYKTGIIGIEEYQYAYDDTTYNLYFEQPRFLFDQLGTREFVVYNPKDDHLMLSHTSWHMLLEPHHLRQTQGWYASYDTGILHWKSFLFD